MGPADVRRSMQVAIHAGPLVGLLATMGRSPHRRAEVGRKIASASADLGGIYPWVAHQLTTPPLAGPDIARGAQQFHAQVPLRQAVLDKLRASSAAREDGPFFHLVKSANLADEDCYVVENRPPSRMVATDVSMVEACFGLLRPLTGPLPHVLVSGISRLIGSRVIAESSLECESVDRLSLPEGFGFIARPLAEGPEAFVMVDTPFSTMDEMLPAHRRRLIALLIRRWSDMVLHSRFLPSDLSLTATGRSQDADVLMLRRLAGSLTASPAILDLLSLISSARERHPAEPGEQLRHSVSQVFNLADQACGGLTKLVALIVDPGSAGIPGPLSALRVLAQSMSKSPDAQITPEAYVLLRQLITFRGMIDEFDPGRHLFDFGSRE